MLVALSPKARTYNVLNFGKDNYFMKSVENRPGVQYEIFFYESGHFIREKVMKF